MCWGYRGGQKKAGFKENVNIVKFVRWETAQKIKRTRNHMLHEIVEGVRDYLTWLIKDSAKAVRAV